MARGEIKISRKPKKTSRAFKKIQQDDQKAKKTVKKTNIEVKPVDKDDNFVVPNTILVNDDDMDLFAQLKQSLSKTKRDNTVSQKIKKQERETIMTNPVKDPQVQAVYNKYFNKNRRDP